jgi:hypothetical protein
MKKTLFFAALIICSSFVFAQDDEDKTFKFGLGGTLSIPTGSLKENFTYGVGFEATGIYSFTENIAAFAQAGIGVFKSSDAFSGDAGNVLHIPLLAGARFKFNGFFVGAGVGYGKWNTSYYGGGGLLYSPQAGYDFGSMHVLLHYTANKVDGGTLSYFGLKFFRTF